MRKLVSRQPPEGFLTWASAILQDELDTHGFIYELEWVEDYGLDVMLDEWARPRKRKMVRVQCSCCGYLDLYHYGRGQKGYGFILPESFTEVEGGMVYEDGEEIRCPNCGVQVQIRRKADLRRKGYFVSAEGMAMSAAVVGPDHLLALTGWVIQRKVSFGGGEHLDAIPAESYVFSASDCTQLKGWSNAYSGHAGYFIQYNREWRQPRDWMEQWGEEDNIFGLTDELVAESACPTASWTSIWRTGPERSTSRWPGCGSIRPTPMWRRRWSTVCHECWTISFTARSGQPSGTRTRRAGWISLSWTGARPGPPKCCT